MAEDKMNWGHKITIVIILFVAGMLGMVYLCNDAGQ